MDFSISTELQQKLDLSQEFLSQKIIPLEPLLLTSQWDQLTSQLEALRQEVKALGLWAPNLPTDCGGSYTDLVTLGLYAEVLGQSPLGHFVFGCQAPDAGNAELLHLHGTDAQKERWMKPLAKGEIRSCFAMTEPHTAGSNPTLLDSSAELEQGQWRINGHKWFTTSADGANFTVAMVVTDPDAQKHQRASMILVPMDNPGVKMIRNIPVMGHTGKGYFSHSELQFVDCLVPEENLLGPRGRGFALAQDRLGPGRIQHCMRWLGISKRALDESCRYVVKRQINSRETLADQQIIKSWIAESAAEMTAARNMVLEAAWSVDNLGFKASRNKISMIKYYTAKVMQSVVDRALQSHGALGMTDDTILAHFFREERASRIYDGPDEVHKMSVARQILKQYQ